jgi:hypothetical protein
MRPILHGQGAQLVRHIPHDSRKRPRVVSSASVLIEDMTFGETSAERVVLASTAATIGSVNTTTTAAAGPGETDTHVIPLTSATSVSVGRPYLMSNTAGAYEYVSIRAINSLNVYSHLELRQDFETGAAFQSVEITASFPAIEADDDDEVETSPHPYQVTWTYTIDSEIYVIPEIVWIQRTLALPVIDELYVLRGFPTIGPRLRNRADIGDAISAATDDFNAEIRIAGRNPAEFRGNETAKVAVRARALQHCFEWMGPAEHDVRQAARYESQFKYLMSQLTDGRPRPGTVTIDQPTNTGAQDTKATHQLWGRR